MRDDVPWSLLDRYFSGECTDAEVARVKAWLDADPEHSRLLATIQEVWALSSMPGRRFDVDAAWAAVRARAAASQKAPAPTDEDANPLRSAGAAARRQSWRERLAAIPLRAVASAALFIAAGVAVLVRWGLHDGREPSMHAYATATGQRAELRLSDGTRIVLSAASRIRIPEDYGHDERTVFLDQGEAFFEVRHDASRPFRVLAAGAVAEDLGTEFLVQANAQDSTVQVVVATGAVALRADRAKPTEGVVLRSRQLGRIDASGGIAVDSGVNIDAYFAWLEGHLSFDQVPLGVVIRDLERWYGVPIRLADPSLAAVPVTASFRDQPFDEIVRVLAAALDIPFTRTAEGVVLSLPEP